MSPKPQPWSLLKRPERACRCLEKLSVLGTPDCGTLRPEAIGGMRHSAVRAPVGTHCPGLDSKLGRMRHRAGATQHEIRNLASTAALCGPTSSREDQLPTAGTRRHLGTLLKTEARIPWVLSSGTFRQFVTGQLGDIGAQQWMFGRRRPAESVPEIRILPPVEGKKGHYIAEGEWNLLGGYGGGRRKLGNQAFVGWLRGKDLNLRPLGYERDDIWLSSS